MAEGIVAGSAFISLRLVARAAGISLAEMQRIAGDLARGRREEWLGAVVQVRTHNQGHGRHRDILTASLPEVLRAELASNRLRFLVAAEHPEPGADLGAADLRLLHRAAQSGIAEDHFDVLVAFLCDGGPLARASRDRFDLIMDRLFGYGFRDPVLFEVGADYLAFLDGCRRDLGISDAAFAALLAEAGASHGGKPMLSLLTGPRFAELLDGIHAARGMAAPALPARRFVTHTVIGQIRAAVRGLGLPYAEHRRVLVTIGGGVRRTRDLDHRGAQRIMCHYISRGYVIA